MIGKIETAKAYVMCGQCGTVPSFSDYVRGSGAF